MVRINWTLQAVLDLKDILDYISRDSKAFAKIQVIKIRNRTKILSLQPYSGKIVPETGNNNLRELIQGNYRIIYKISENDLIDILTIHHSARDLTIRNIK